MGLVLAPEKIPDRDVAIHDPTLSKLVGERPDCDVGLLRDALHQPVAFGLEYRSTIPADLAGSEATSRLIAAHQLDHRRFAHIEPRRD